MRITNQMLTRNTMHNINRNKNSLALLEEQYSSGKKIQRPSQDPIIAVRALKLRTNLKELNQYYEKNIPDAKSWMDVTESALTNINSILTKINTSCVQGANDPLTASDRTSIVQNLEEYKKQIYQEGNSNYAGRYVFTGYKTDTSLVFNDNTTNLQYSITEKLSGQNIESISKVVGSYSLDDYKPATSTSGDFSDAPTLTNTHRMRLSYNSLDNTDINSFEYKVKDAAGNLVDKKIPDVGNPLQITKVSINDPLVNAYAPGDNDIYFIPESGELVLGKNAYEELRLAEDINVNYDKSKFSQGELRPEHYFTCDVTDTSAAVPETKTYTKSDQKIQYEINFNQKLTVNTQGSDALVHGIGRDIDEIIAATMEVSATEEKIAEVNKMLEDNKTTPEQKIVLNQLKEQLNTELVLKNKLLQDKFEQGIAGSSKHQDTVNTAIADLGSRYVRLELTESRLSNQQIDFEDLLSTNEDADVVETFIKLSSQEAIYTASLSAASKIVKNTLLDFL